MSKPLSPSSPAAATKVDANASSWLVERREWVVLVVICLLGLGLRLWRMDRLSIEHFDEGVYAANVYAILDNHCYPQRHLYAPPLFPLLCELAIGIGRTPDASVWVNLLFGSLMVPLVWVVARHGFGPVAAIVSSVLCATSDYHIFFSRSALTDVSLCFWLLLAVWLAGRGMRSGNGLTLGGAAIAAALAWWTKYNGWLAIAIPLGGWGLLAVVTLLKSSVPLQTRLASIDREGLFRWGIFAVLAGLLWSPVVYDLQAVGGYSVVSANHAQYLVGLAGWWDGFRMHVAFHGWLTTVVGVSGALVAGGLLLLAQGKKAVGLAAALACFVPCAVVGGLGATLGIVAFFSAVRLVIGWFSPNEGLSPDRRLLEAVLVTWWVGLTLTTPLYTPYARLSLPWMVSCWLLVGVFFEFLIQSSFTRQRLAARGLGLMGLGLCFVMFVGRPETHATARDFAIRHAWGDRTSLRHATGQILHETDMGRREMPPSETAECEYAIYVVGEPALFCHLTQQSAATVVTKPASSVGEVAAPHRVGPAFPKFIVTGSHVAPSDIDEAVAAGRIELIWEQRVLVSDLVALDSASLGQLQHSPFKGAERPENTIPLRVFRIRE